MPYGKGFSAMRKRKNWEWTNSCLHIIVRQPRIDLTYRFLIWLGFGVTYLPLPPGLQNWFPEYPANWDDSPENTQASFDQIVTMSKRLKSISLRSSMIVLDQRGIANLRYLKSYFTSTACPHPIDLSGCKNLELLGWQGKNMRFSGLSELAKLKYIHAESVGNKWLMGLPKTITHLYLTNARLAEKFSSFPKLKVLGLSRQRTLDISKLQLPSSLIRLDLVSIANIENFQRVLLMLPNLEKVNIRDVGVSSKKEIVKICRSGGIECCVLE